MRLFHKLFLFFSLTAMVAALAMAGVLAWNLDRGFSAYLDARDAEMLDSFVSDFEGELATSSAAGNFHPDVDSLVEVMRQMAGDGRIRELPPVPDDAPPPYDAPPPGDRFGATDARSGGRGLPPDQFGARLRLFDRDGTLIFGPPTGPLHVESDALTRPIVFKGAIVANAGLLQRGPAPRSIDTGFLRGQYTGVASVTALLLLASALSALLLARAGVRQIAAVGDATRAIIGGDLATRIAVRGSDEIATMCANINDMAASLQRLESARRRWLAEISHELRTPLTVLRGELEALQDGIRPIDMAAVHSLSDEAQRLELLIEDLHFLAVSDLGTPPHQPSSFDAVAFTRDVAVRFRSAFEDAGLAFEIDAGKHLTLPVFWDRQRIEHLLGNVVTNAIRYTDSPGKVRLALTTTTDWAKFTIEDSAPGVAANQLSELFEPLHRLDAARDRVSGGSGLGLAVAKAIVATHGGRIAAAQSILGGLQITIDLPVEARQQ